MCKHYLYSINIHKDFESFNTLKSIYGEKITRRFCWVKYVKGLVKTFFIRRFSDGALKSCFRNK